MADEPIKICLRSGLSLGDIVALTGTLESLHLQFPGKYETYVSTTCDQVWEHNPRVAGVIPWQSKEEDLVLPEGVKLINCNYPTVNVSNQRSVSFFDGYRDDLAKRLNIPLELQVNRPYIYLSEEEQSWISMIEEHFTKKKTRFWLVSGGCKKDYTIKAWPFYQQVVDHFAGRVQFVQIGQSKDMHVPLKGVINLIDQTDVRQLIRLVSHCEGGLGPITGLAHLCAAFNKAYVCIGGGREPAMWMNNYHVNHLLQAGPMKCMGNHGCWLSRVVPLGDGDKKDDELCRNPVFTQFPYPVAKCMSLISPQEVCLTIERILYGFIA
jgi:ADP-heptose:LPS heptosyltransferase